MTRLRTLFWRTIHDAHDPAFWPVFFILGVPLIALTGGPYGWRFLVLLGALAALTSHPLITGAVIVLYLLRWPLRIFVEAVIIGLAGGISARLTGVFNSPERAERMRERWLAQLNGRRGCLMTCYEISRTTRPTSNPNAEKPKLSLGMRKPPVAFVVDDDPRKHSEAR